MSVSAIGGATNWSSVSFRPPRAGGDDDPLKGVADKLGLSQGDLMTALQSGRSLGDVAQEAGVSRDDLLTTIKDGLKSHAPDGAPSLSDDQLDELATSIVDGSGPPEPPGGFGQIQGFGGFGGASFGGQSTNLFDLMNDERTVDYWA